MNRDISVSKINGYEPIGTTVGTCVIDGKKIYCDTDGYTISIKEYISETQELSLLKSVTIHNDYVSSITCNEYGIFFVTIDKSTNYESLCRMKLNGKYSYLYSFNNTDTNNYSGPKVMTYKNKYVITHYYGSGTIVDLSDNYKKYWYYTGDTNSYMNKSSGYYGDILLYNIYDSSTKLYTLSDSLENEIKGFSSYDGFEPEGINHLNIQVINGYKDIIELDSKDAVYYEDDLNVIFASSFHDKYNHSEKYSYLSIDKNTLSITSRSIDFTNTGDDSYSPVGYSTFYDKSNDLLYSNGVCASLKDNKFMQDKCHSNRPVTYIIPAWIYNLE